jgi:uncharacterized protein
VTGVSRPFSARSVFFPSCGPPLARRPSPPTYADDVTAHVPGRVVVPVTTIPDMVTFAQLADPEGNVIGLVEAAPAVEDPPPRKYVVFYESSERVAELAPLHFAAHSARVAEFKARGDLLQVGTFANPYEEGSMSVFSSREAAERFIEGDPFRIEGVIKAWNIKEWYAD